MQSCSCLSGASSPIIPVILEPVITRLSVMIVWSVGAVAYTPEHYTIHYSSDEAVDFTVSIEGTQNILAADMIYSALLTNLLPNTLYFYKIVSTNSFTSSETDVESFITPSSGKGQIYLSFKFVKCVYHGSYCND